LPTGKAIVSVSINPELRQWAHYNRISISTYTNAVLDLLARHNIVGRTRDTAQARKYIIKAVLRELGLDVDLDTINDIFAGRVKLRLVEVG